MKAAILISAACGVVLVVTATALPGSIWARANGAGSSLYIDDVARSVGDIITVIISERTVIENETNRNLDKQSSRANSMDGTLDLANIAGSVGQRIFDFPKLSFSSSAKNKFDGKAAYDSERSLTDQITVTVQDVLPNGNLVLLGRRERNTAGDRQIIRISGIVRPRDITFANTVRSDRIADFRIAYTDPAPERRFTKPGWLARLLNFLNPF